MCVEPAKNLCRVFLQGYCRLSATGNICRSPDINECVDLSNNLQCMVLDQTKNFCIDPVTKVC